MFPRLLCFVCCAMLASDAQAHFLWLATDPAGKPGEIQAFFSENASPDDPALLEKFGDLKAFAISPGRDNVKREEIAFKRTDGQLTGSFLAETQAPIVARHLYGVVNRGDEAFLLTYYAKAYPSLLPGNWQSVALQDDQELTALEITPQLRGKELVLSVTWRGKPAAGDQVTVEGPGFAEKLQGDTDDKGQFRCRPSESGLFSLRARHTEKRAGKLGDESYSAVRHYATLSLWYSVPSLVPQEHALPELPRGITSFGAAIAEDALYIYGGHFGSAHHYSTSGQSDEFRRLPLRGENPAWETLPSGPKLTGLSLVSHEGKLYRLGGFTVKNGDDQPQDLWSQDEFAAFDPAANAWRDLAPLPEPRSSHDAAVLNGRIYVVGGWNMEGPEQTTWHTTAWVCDLNQEELVWTPIAAPPFQRRALSLAAHQGKIFVLGGMQESGKPTTRVDVFDPETGTWSRGPDLIGTGMEGFGSSAFALNGRLLATTMSGSIQQLSEEGSRWEIVSQLQFPRFFHRQLTTADGELLAIGGASMQAGKTNSIEVFRPVAK